MPIEPLPRRKFLKFATLSIAAMGSAAALFYSVADAPEPEATEFGLFLVLTSDTAKTLFAVSEVALPASHVADRALHQQVLFRIDEELSFVSNTIQEDFRLALTALEYLPFTYGYFSRFSKLSVAERSTFFSKLQKTSNATVRAIANNCRVITLYIFYGVESSWNSIGYDGSFSKLTPLISEQRRFYAQSVGRKAG